MLFNFPSVQFLEKFGLQATFKMCGTILVFGSWIRYYTLALQVKGEENFWLVLIPQLLLACNQPFMGNGLSKLVTQWFGDDERTLATTLATFGKPFGSILGFMFGAFYVKNSDKYDHVAGKEHTVMFLRDSSIVVTLLILPLIMLFKDKPAEYPSKGAEDLEKQKTSYSFMSDLKLLWNNKNFCRFALSYMNTYSIYTCLTAIVSNLLTPYGYSPAEASMIGILFISFGLVAAFGVSIKVDKNKKYLMTYRIICFGTLVCSLAFLITLPLRNTLVICLNNLLFGIFLVPLTPIGYSFSVEMTFPVSAVMSIGII